MIEPSQPFISLKLNLTAEIEVQGEDRQTPAFEGYRQ